MSAITHEQVRESVKDAVASIIEDYKDEPDTDRETVMDRVFKETDSAFGNLVQHGPISEYDVDDLIRTAQPCGAILQVAQEDAWIEDDAGLWKGLTYGVLASIAFFSLEHLIFQALEDAGHDTNEDYPFAAPDAD